MKHTRTTSRGLAGMAGALSLLAGCASTTPSSVAPGDAPSAAMPAPAPLAEERRAPRAEPTAPLVQAAPVAPPTQAALPQLQPVPEQSVVRIDAPAPRHADLWHRMRAGFAMPPLDSPLVAEKERFYLSKPEYLQRMFQRGGKYLHHIMEELEKRGMPAELALLPFVESAMNPKALSSAQAAGLWQFIPGTGKQYNLAQNWWVDNRRDVVQSTQAAIEYLQKIYVMQGNDWFLALASYNWGEGSVQRAMKKNVARGLPTDYLSLTMPEETRHYVPKLIALKNIVMRADELGLKLPAIPDKPYFVTVEKTRPIDLKLAAKFAGMTVDEFVALNPAHNRPVIAASRNNQIKLPIDRIDAFLDAVARHGETKKPLATWQPYTLQPGESIEHLAARSGTTATEIKQANSLQLSGRILPGTRLLAPQPDAKDEMQVEQFVAPRVYEAIDKPAAYHTVGKKESVHGIAERYGVTATALRAWNNVKASIKRGMTLLVRPAATQTILTDERGDKQVVSVAYRGAAVERAARAEESAAAEPAVANEPAARAVEAAPAARRASEGLAPALRATSSAHARALPARADDQPARSVRADLRENARSDARDAQRTMQAEAATACAPGKRTRCTVAAETRARVVAPEPSRRAKSAASVAHSVPVKAAKNEPRATAAAKRVVRDSQPAARPSDAKARQRRA